MRKLATYSSALLCAAAAHLSAQEPATGACSIPETIAVSGAVRNDTAAVRASSALVTGQQLAVHDIQAAIKALYATGQFDDVQIICRMSPTNKAGLVIQVKER